MAPLGGLGGLHPASGVSPPMPGGGYWRGWKIARAAVLLSDASGGYTLDGWGGLHPFGAAPAATGAAYFGWGHRPRRRPASRIILLTRSRLHTRWLGWPASVWRRGGAERRPLLETVGHRQAGEAAPGWQRRLRPRRLGGPASIRRRDQQPAPRDHRHGLLAELVHRPRLRSVLE